MLSAPSVPLRGTVASIPVAMLLVAILVAGLLWLHPGSLALRLDLTAGWLVPAAMAGTCIDLARRQGGRRIRLAALLAAVTMALVAAGGVLEAIASSLQGVPTNPPAATACYGAALATAILAAAALPFLPRAGLVTPIAVIDAAVVTVAVAIIAWRLGLDTAYREAHVVGSARTTPLIFPTATFMAGILLAFQMAKVERGRRLPAGLMVAGLLALAASNVGFILLAYRGVYTIGSPVDGGFLIGYVLIGAGVTRTSKPAPAPAHEDQVTPAQVAITAGAATAALATALWPGLGSLQTDSVATACLPVVAGLLTARLLFGSLETSRLRRVRTATLSELVRTEARLQHVLGTAPVMAFTVASDRSVRVWHPTPPGDEPGDWDRRREAMEAALTTPAGPLEDLVGAAFAGSQVSAGVRTAELDVVVHLTPERDRTSGGVGSVTGIAVDVAERRRAEEAERESEAKTRFLAHLSHELRTPLNSVLGFAQVLLEGMAGPLSERQRRYVSNIHQSGRHLLELIEDLLDLTAAQADRLRVEVRPVPVREVVEAAVAKVRPLANERGHRLSLEPGGDLIAHADRRRLQQVLLNLLSNAVKYTPPGGRISVEAVATARGVEVTVTDTGLGLSEGAQELIFDEFYQVDSGKSRSRDGVGLGLPLSRHLSELMGARLEVSSRLGAGSRFSVVLRPAPGRRRPADPHPVPAPPILRDAGGES